MKPGSNMKGRPRGRNQVNKGRGPSRNQTFDSNGPGTRVRGNVHQVVEKYQALARDAAAQGDRVLCENYLQHAEHYYRLALAMNANNPQRAANRLDQNQALVTEGPDDFYDEGEETSDEQYGAERGYRDDGQDQPRENGHDRGQGRDRQGHERHNGERTEAHQADQQGGGRDNNRRRRSRSMRARDAAAAEAEQRSPADDDQREEQTAPKANGNGAHVEQPSAEAQPTADEKPKKTVRRRRSTKATDDGDGGEREAATA